MYWDSFRFVARDLGVRYMMAPSRTRSELVSRRLPCEYLRQLRRCWVRGSSSSATWLLAATKAQPLGRFPWLGQHLPLVSILIFWFLLRVVDEALSIDGQGEFRAIAMEIVLGHAHLFHDGGQHLMNHPHALQQFVHVSTSRADWRLPRNVATRRSKTTPDMGTRIT